MPKPYITNQIQHLEKEKEMGQGNANTNRR